MKINEVIMDWVQVLTIVGILLVGIFYIHSDIKEIKRDSQQQSARIDRLYEMFIDLLKHKNTP